jgi:hypothetical protein
VSAELVLENGRPLDRRKGTTDVHLRGVPVLTPLPRVMATRRGKTARRRANSRVSVSWTPKGVGWRK